MKNLTVALFILGICFINISVLKADENKSIRSNDTEEVKVSVNPLTHYGFVYDFSSNCCKRGYHDDECTGAFC